jgi:hypothetical protein
VTELNDESLHDLKYFFDKTRHDDQVNLLRVFRSNTRKDLLTIVTKFFGINLAKYHLSVTSPELPQEEVIIPIKSEFSDTESDNDLFDKQERVWSDDA